MRPIVVLIGLAALIVAACGSNAPASPSASASAPAPSQASAHTPSPSTGMTFTVRLPAVGGKRVRVIVHDVNGVIAALRASTAKEAKSVSNAFDGSNAAVTGGKSAKVLVVGWKSTACDKKVDIAVQNTNVVVAPAAVGTCIGKAVTRSVTISFTTKIDAEAMTATFVPPTQP